jgi:hypothetical protein
MNLQLHIHGIEVSRRGRQRIEDVVTTSLARWEHRIQSVSLSLRDTNGPRGGRDLECRCVVSLSGLPSIVISDSDASVQTLTYRVANRAAFNVSQKIDRRNKRTHRSRNSAVTELQLAAAE